MNPPNETESTFLTVYYILQDNHREQPKNKKYDFKVNVIHIDFAAVEEATTKRVSTLSNRTYNEIRVFVDEPDALYYQFYVRFSQPIQLPKNATEWDINNEGSKRMNITYVASEETLTLLYDQDLDMNFSWNVIETGTNEVDDEEDAK